MLSFFISRNHNYTLISFSVGSNVRSMMDACVCEQKRVKEFERQTASSAPSQVSPTPSTLNLADAAAPNVSTPEQQAALDLSSAQLANFYDARSLARVRVCLLALCTLHSAPLMHMRVLTVYSYHSYEYE